MNKQSLLKPPRSQRLLYKCEKIPQGFIKAADEQTERPDTAFREIYNNTFYLLIGSRVKLPHEMLWIIIQHVYKLLRQK